MRRVVFSYLVSPLAGGEDMDQSPYQPCSSLPSLQCRDARYDAQPRLGRRLGGAAELSPRLTKCRLSGLLILPRGQ